MLALCAPQKEPRVRVLRYFWSIHRRLQTRIRQTSVLRSDETTGILLFKQRSRTYEDKYAYPLFLLLSTFPLSSRKKPKIQENLIRPSSLAATKKKDITTIDGTRDALHHDRQRRQAGKTRRRCHSTCNPFKVIASTRRRTWLFSKCRECQ